MLAHINGGATNVIATDGSTISRLLCGRTSFIARGLIAWSHVVRSSGHLAGLADVWVSRADGLITLYDWGEATTTMLAADGATRDHRRLLASHLARPHGRQTRLPVEAGL